MKQKSNSPYTTRRKRPFNLGGRHDVAGTARYVATSCEPSDNCGGITDSGHTTQPDGVSGLGVAVSADRHLLRSNCSNIIHTKEMWLTQCMQAFAVMQR